MHNITPPTYMYIVYIHSYSMYISIEYIYTYTVYTIILNIIFITVLCVLIQANADSDDTESDTVSEFSEDSRAYSAPSSSAVKGFKAASPSGVKPRIPPPTTAPAPIPPAPTAPVVSCTIVYIAATGTATDIVVGSNSSSSSSSG